MRKCNELALHFQNKLLSVLMGSCKVFPSSYIALSILNGISNIRVRMLTKLSLTFINKNKNPRSEWMQNTGVASVILSCLLYFAFCLLSARQTHSNNWNLTSVSCNPFHKHEKFPLGEVTGSRQWKSMTHSADAPMVSFCTYRSQPLLWLGTRTRSLVLSFDSYAAAGGELSDSGNILQICSILASLQSEAGLSWPAAPGGNPHGTFFTFQGTCCLPNKINPKLSTANRHWKTFPLRASQNLYGAYCGTSPCAKQKGKCTLRKGKLAFSHHA